jgi:hypothetical protein
MFIGSILLKTSSELKLKTNRQTSLTVHSKTVPSDSGMYGGTGTAVPVDAVKADMGSRGIAPLITNLGA